MNILENMARNASCRGLGSEHFKVAAQRHANATWLWAIVGSIVAWWATPWVWALLPFGLGALSALQSVSSTSIAIRLEKIEAEK